jgi:predicted lipoprotein
MVALSKLVPGRRRALSIVLWLLAIAIFTWFFPLFHIVRLAEKQSQSKSSEFDARAVAEQFWTQRLLPALGQAADVTEVISAARSDPKQVRSRFGRTVGLSRSYFLFVRGSGTVLTVDKAGVNLAIGGSAPSESIILRTGPIFGSAVRDATGLLEASSFPNSRQFNDLAAELNNIVQKMVTAKLKEEAQPGQRIEFVGCAEVQNEPGDLNPLKIVPLSVKVLSGD